MACDDRFGAKPMTVEWGVFVPHYFFSLKSRGGITSTRRFAALFEFGLPPEITLYGWGTFPLCRQNLIAMISGLRPQNSAVLVWKLQHERELGDWPARLNSEVKERVALFLGVDIIRPLPTAPLASGLNCHGGLGMVSRGLYWGVFYFFSRCSSRNCKRFFFCFLLLTPTFYA